jgi:energy-coupling factor transporter ATP-binding protein EcfA2
MPPSYDVHDVFTPSTQAQLNFVDRASVNPQLMDAIFTAGKQLIVYGESGCGKSTLLMNKLRDTYHAYITTRCSKATTYEQLLLDAFDQLDPFYTQGRNRTSSKSISPALQAAFVKVSASLSRTESEQQNRALPLQLTAQRLAEFLGAQSMCWVVEDFHKMPAEEKIPFAQSLKIFSDASTEYPDVMVIAIGATDTAREVVEYDSEMTNRVSELYVPPMTPEELGRIIEHGQDLLNVNLSAVADGLVEYSLGMPSTCHQLALSTCVEKGVMKTQKVRLAFTWRDLDPAMNRWIGDSSDTIKSRLFRALGRRVVGKYDNCGLILAAVSSGPLLGMTFDEILAKIRCDQKDYPDKNLRRYLRELTKDERGALLKAVAGGKWRFASAVYHTLVQAMLSKPRQSAADPSPRQYVEQAVTRSWTDAVYSSPTLSSTVLSDGTGTYYLDMKSYFEPIASWSGGGLTISTAGSVIPESKKPALYEAPARRRRQPT